MPETVTTPVSWLAKEEAIRALERNGVVDPRELIAVAQDPDHPCHGDFTWDVDQAAMERWRDQARSLIRKCKFMVLVEDVTERVVRYVESPDGDSQVFVSLPRLRSASKMSSVMTSELAMLHGNAARVYGIAVSKVGLVGADMVTELRSIRDQIAALKASLEE